ncbi:tRNA (guanosine(46)-N7)-methyltransferase TrmB [Spiribacter sp. SSL99]|uniref:tRNA (guanosine(46)-N7)-methyltransferase TrmB n=1 Tax=Spiribacter sp. SSL99 TaxID=1866884 RepID=UPI00132FE5D7|nr:tRNA (guanosine(46)-N7)-methyltransferase TrmB [Spiribacter sp. SSL99]KAF0285023.1 tRNA (guanosine(46)-N7)-methyltransferase TrmB [Spiribacter sp. SSL99]
MSTTGYRPIRSFVRREGRLTAGQQRALDELYPRYGVDWSGGRIDVAAGFERPAPLVLDIGFGDGDALAEIAAAHPDRNYLGVEVYRTGTGRLLRRIESEGLTNLRVLLADASELLRDGLAPVSLAGVQLFFPDPWTKKRHHKRRIVQAEWLARVADRLQPGGFLHMATDWADYAEWMLSLSDAEPRLENPYGGYAPDAGDRPETRFERRGRRKGHEVYDLILQRVDV